MSDSVTDSLPTREQLIEVLESGSPFEEVAASIRAMMMYLQREAVDAFIEKELPGLLRKTFSTIYWTDEFLAAKIAELRNAQPDDETIARVMGKVGRLDKEDTI